MIKMKIKKVLSVFLLMTVVLLAGCVSDENLYSDGNESLKEESVAPDFTAKMTDGSTFVLSEAKGSVIILNFWATWCGPCCEELPAFQKLYEQYGDKIKVVAVDYAEPEKVVNEFLSKNGYTFPVAYDENAEISALYPSDGIPYTLIIDEEGIIKNTFLGATSADAQYDLYRAAIEEALND